MREGRMLLSQVGFIHQQEGYSNGSWGTRWMLSNLCTLQLQRNRTILGPIHATRPEPIPSSRDEVLQSMI